MSSHIQIIFRQTVLAQALITSLCLSAHAEDAELVLDTDGEEGSAISLLTPEQIDQKLTTLVQHMPITPSTEPISHIGSTDAPLGLDTQAITRLPTLQSVMQTQENTAELDPNLYLPKYEYQETAQETQNQETDSTISVNPIKKLYNQLFNDGLETPPKLGVHLYYDQSKEQTQPPAQKVTNTKALVKLTTKQARQEPFANIKAVLEDMTAQSVADFRSSVPRLRQAVRTAGRAVGYYEMDFTLTKAKADEVNVIIHRLGEPVRVEHQTLEVRGEGASDPDYIKLVQNPPLKQGDIFHHGNYEATKSAINDVGGEKGYFDSKWLSNAVDVVLPDNIADVSLVYESGKQYAFDKVVFFTVDKETGNLTTDPDKLPVKPELLNKLMTFEMGDAYNRSAMRNLNNSLLATGYFNAVNTEVVLPAQAEQAGVDFESIEPDEAQGQTITLDDELMADIAPLEFTPSQVLTEKLSLVRQKAERLYNAPDDRLLITDTRGQSKSILGRISDALSSIAKMILPDESSDVLSEMVTDPQRLANRKSPQEVYQDKKVPLYVFVMSDKPKDAELGFGWGSDSGVRLIGKFEHNLINKDGLQAGADVRLSTTSQGVQTYITRPMSHPLNDTIKGSLSFLSEVVNQGTGNFNLDSKTLEAGLSRNIIRKNGWSRTYGLRYHLDALQTHTPQAVWQDLPIHFLNGTPTQEALLAGYAMNKTVLDNPLTPLRGYRQHYSLEAGVKGFASDANMAIVRAGISGVYSFGENDYGKNRQHQVMGSLQGGYLWTDNFNAVPYKLRFFAGGDQSIRGYSYRSLSPYSSKGYLTGGQTLLVASGEYNYEVLEGLRIGVFADMGNAYDKQFSNDTKIGAGVGIRWASPVGQVRVDVATAVNEPNRSVRLHFFVGTPF